MAGPTGPSYSDPKPDIHTAGTNGTFMLQVPTTGPSINGLGSTFNATGPGRDLNQRTPTIFHWGGPRRAFNRQALSIGGAHGLLVPTGCSHDVFPYVVSRSSFHARP